MQEGYDGQATMLSFCTTCCTCIKLHSIMYACIIKCEYIIELSRSQALAL